MSRYPESLTWGQILAYRDAEARDDRIERQDY